MGEGGVLISCMAIDGGRSSVVGAMVGRGMKQVFSSRRKAEAGRGGDLGKVREPGTFEEVGCG